MTKRAESCLTGSLVHESVSNPHGYWQPTHRIEARANNGHKGLLFLTLLIKGEVGFSLPIHPIHLHSTFQKSYIVFYILLYDEIVEFIFIEKSNFYILL